MVRSNAIFSPASCAFGQKNAGVPLQWLAGGVEGASEVTLVFATRFFSFHSIFLEKEQRALIM